jgi:violaxanthin de-epoxidase
MVFVLNHTGVYGTRLARLMMIQMDVDLSSPRSKNTKKVATMKITTFFFLIAAGATTTLGFAPPRNAYSIATRDAHIAYQSRHEQDSMTRIEKKDPLQRVGNALKSSVLALGISMAALTSPAPVMAADSGAIVSCLFSKCQLPLAKCIANPKCLANVICINTCNGRDDEIGCQIKCGDLFDNEVVGEFNKCVVSDMGCVPQKPDEGLYPELSKDKLVSNFDTKLWNGRWYISAGQNALFDIFPCQVHFFTETAPGTFYGKLNWRVEEPDGEYFTRDALQQFVQDPNNPAHLINHDNEYLHYKDDWYIVDYEYDDNKDGVPPFAFVYYRGSNDAWDGYGGVVVYTRDAKLPESLIPRLRIAAQKIGYDFDKDFTITDNSCPTIREGEALVLREKFAGKVLLQTEESVRAQAVRLRGNALNSVKAQKVFFSNEGPAAQKAFEKLSESLKQFETEQATAGKQ